MANADGNNYIEGTTHLLPIDQVGHQMAELTDETFMLEGH